MIGAPSLTSHNPIHHPQGQKVQSDERSSQYSSLPTPSEQHVRHRARTESESTFQLRSPVSFTPANSTQARTENENAFQLRSPISLPSPNSIQTTDEEEPLISRSQPSRQTNRRGDEADRASFIESIYEHYDNLPPRLIPFAVASLLTFLVGIGLKASASNQEAASEKLLSISDWLLVIGAFGMTSTAITKIVVTKDAMHHIV